MLIEHRTKIEGRSSGATPQMQAVEQSRVGQPAHRSFLELTSTVEIEQQGEATGVIGADGALWHVTYMDCGRAVVPR